MRSCSTNPRVALALELLIVAAAAVAFSIGGGIGDGLVSGAIVLAFVVVVEVGRRRSSTFAAMSGLGDERERDIYQRAVAFAGTVMSVVLPAWAFVTAARGRMDVTLVILCVVFAVTWLGAVLVLSRRG